MVPSFAPNAMVAGTCSILVEGPKRAQILAIYMACIAVSSKMT